MTMTLRVFPTGSVWEKTEVYLRAVTLGVLLFLSCGCRGPIASEADDASTPKTSERIVSMAPSATEVLFALGLGERVAAVTRYCTYPPEAQDKEQIGGFLDPSLEAVLRVRPDLVVVLSIHGETTDRLSELGLNVLVVEHRTLDGILESIAQIGERCGVDDRADALLAEMRAEMERVARAVEGRERPSVLISAGRGYGSGSLQQVYAAGRGQWYDDIIRLAGGRNAFENENIMFPALSGEGLLRLNPDVIIEMAPSIDEEGITAEEVVAEWDAFGVMNAVRDGRVHVLTPDYVTIPGPRFVRVLDDVARALHPDAFSGQP